MVELIKMSSKGQIVIPRQIRKIIHAEEGSIFAVMNSDDSVVLKKIETPSKEQLIKDIESIAKKGKKRAEKLEIKESEVNKIVHRSRRTKSS